MPVGVVAVGGSAVIAAVDGWVGGEKLTRVERLDAVSTFSSSVCFKGLTLPPNKSTRYSPASGRAAARVLMLKKKVMSKKRMANILPIAAIDTMEVDAASVSDASCSEIVRCRIERFGQREASIATSKVYVGWCWVATDWKCISWRV
jgi:hypothetical protein